MLCTSHLRLCPSVLAEALSTAAGIYHNPLPLDISDGFKETFATASRSKAS